MSVILGITGRARSGKNCVASGIEEAAKRLGIDYKVYEISEYVLKSLQYEGQLVGKTRESLTSEDIELMVNHGNFHRGKDPWHWVDRVFTDISYDNPEVAILPNIRFKNESAAVRAYGLPGRIIRVKSLIRDGIEWISTDRDPNNQMEIENYQIDADYFLMAKKGHTKLLQMEAATLFEYIYKNGNN